MLSSLISTLRADAMLLGFAALVTLLLAYMIVLRINIYIYAQKHETRPLHYKIFRVYNKSLITNCPSKSEKKFYAKTNKITLFFNSALILTFLVVVYVSMR